MLCYVLVRCARQQHAVLNTCTLCYAMQRTHQRRRGGGRHSGAHRARQGASAPWPGPTCCKGPARLSEEEWVHQTERRPHGRAPHATGSYRPAGSFRVWFMHYAHLYVCFYPAYLCNDLCNDLCITCAMSCATTCAMTCVMTCATLLVNRMVLNKDRVSLGLKSASKHMSVL